MYTIKPAKCVWLFASDALIQQAEAVFHMDLGLNVYVS